MWWWTIIPPTRGHGTRPSGRCRDDDLTAAPSLLVVVFPAPRGDAGAGGASVVGAAVGA